MDSLDDRTDQITAHCTRFNMDKRGHKRPYQGDSDSQGRNTRARTSNGGYPSAFQQNNNNSSDQSKQEAQVVSLITRFPPFSLALTKRVVQELTSTPLCSSPSLFSPAPPSSSAPRLLCSSSTAAASRSPALTSATETWSARAASAGREVSRAGWKPLDTSSWSTAAACCPGTNV